MTWAAWIPGAVAVLGSLVVLLLAARAASEIDGLRRELQRWADLRPLVTEVRSAAEAVRSRAPRRPLP